ncbi:hypothetical protein SpCBS45565_g06944 [Spizellomyces sp. 'palustris']|nr:hypothetical protein SpCBS45565_g06944 [Spizellomyces sp. 'palustris']
MALGVLLGYFVPSIRTVLNSSTIVDVSLPIAIGLLWMMYPVFCKVKYEKLSKIFQTTGVFRNLASSVLFNWLLAPLMMAALAWATLPDLSTYRTGVLLVGVARCIAMVLIWNELAGGDREWCAVLIALNSILQVVLYGPLAYFYTVIIGKGSSIDIDMWLVTRSVLIFLGIPLLAGFLTRFVLCHLCRGFLGETWYERKFLKWIGPTSLLGLLFTIVVMFALQGRRIIDNINGVLRVAVPLILYFCIIFALALLACAYLRMPYRTAVTQSFTAASNNFELAIAVAVATFGIDSQEALATVIGPLIEVPVLLGLVYLSLWFRPHYPVVEEMSGKDEVEIVCSNPEAGGPSHSCDTTFGVMINEN